MSAPKTSVVEWLCTGREIFPAMLAAIEAAQESVRLETYIFNGDELGRKFLAALTRAARRGVRVSVLVDAIGSWLLPANFFEPLATSGGEARRFNPLHLWRFGVRDHRKLLVCDEAVAFVGGFNVGYEFDGDGVTCGWCDTGLRLRQPALAKELAGSFDALFALADFKRRPWQRLRVFKRRRTPRTVGRGEFLPSQPGRGASPFQAALHHDLADAREVRIMSAYFLPTRRVRHEIIRAARRGARVQIILAGKTDVFVSQLAARSLYHRLLKAGVEIYEYQPQILHAKLVICDDTTYVGSSNLDVRSLNLNYELMLRFANEAITVGARETFKCALKHSIQVKRDDWEKSLTFWPRLKNSWAHFLLARIDPLVALRQFRAVRK
jgi:cardiolipin synthase